MFFAIAQFFGWLGVKLYSGLIGTGNDPNKLFIGYLIGAGAMIIGGLVEIFLGVAAEGKSLEDVASPLSMVRSEGAACGQGRRPGISPCPELEPPGPDLRRPADPSGPATANTRLAGPRRLPPGPRPPLAARPPARSGHPARSSRPCRPPARALLTS